MHVNPPDIQPSWAVERPKEARRSRDRGPLFGAEIAAVEACIVNLERLASAVPAALPRVGDPTGAATRLADAHAALKACVARLSTLL